MNVILGRTKDSFVVVKFSALDPREWLGSNRGRFHRRWFRSSYDLLG